MKGFPHSLFWLFIVFFWGALSFKAQAQDSIAFIRPYIRLVTDTEKGYDKEYGYRIREEQRIDSLLRFKLPEYKINKRLALYKVEGSPLKSYLDLLWQDELTEERQTKLMEAISQESSTRYVLFVLVEPRVVFAVPNYGNGIHLPPSAKTYIWKHSQNKLFLFDTEQSEIHRREFRSSIPFMKKSRIRQFNRTLKKLLE